MSFLTPELFYSLLIASAAALAAEYVGVRILSKLGLGDSPPEGNFLVGLIFFSIWSILLGATGVLGPFLAALPILAFLPAIAAMRGRMRSRTHVIRAFRAAVRENKLLMGFAVSGIIAGIIGALLPPVGMDALTYHLALPDQYLIRGSIAPPGVNGYYLYFQQYEMAIIPILAADRSGGAADIFSFFIYLSAVGLAGRLGYRFAEGAFSEKRALQAGFTMFAVSATSPLLVDLVFLTKNDLLSTAFALWCALLLSSFADRSHFAAALIGGAAIAVKPPAAAIVVPLLIAFGQWNFRRVIPMLILLAILPTFWVIRNFLSEGIFLAPSYLDTSSHSTLPWHRDSLLGSLINIASNFGHLGEAYFFHIRAWTDGAIGGGLFFLGLGSLFALSSKSSSSQAKSRNLLRRMQAATILILIAWSVLGKGQARFFLPGAIVIAAFWTTPAISVRIIRALILAAVTASVFLVGIVAEEEHHISDIFQSSIAPRDYVTEWVDSYELVNRASKFLDDDAYILAVGEAELFHLHRKADFEIYWERSRAVEFAHRASHDPSSIIETLRSKGYTHILYNPERLKRFIDSRVAPAPECAEDLRALDRAMNRLELLDQDERFGIRLLKLPGSK